MIVGMDFGTTNSGISFYDGRQLQLIPLDRASANPHVARTALYITNQRRVYLGREAIDRYYQQNINRKVKYQRVWVGEITLEFAELPTWVRDVSVEKDVLSPGRLFLSFKTGLHSPGYLGTVVGSQFYLLEDIVALYLYMTRLRAEAVLGTDLRQIVLGRPVHFATDPQQDKLAEQRLVHAAFLAGYEEVYLQAEPIAAAHFYETTLDHPENVLIFDFGGGTLDITIARLGDPQGRAILATGGVPIAGDIFDQKLVRAKLPHHFGEGSHYQDDMGRTLPVPANFFEAFADWQELLNLNRPDFLLMLDHIMRTADKRRQINRLRDLITSSYSLKMYDAVEATKRELSHRSTAAIHLDGPGFSVHQLLSDQEFERIIQEEARTIINVLDDVIQRAGLREDEIDAVIRTGGSAQIPLFIRLLEQRFGKARVREIDTFSSVTSGLGILGHQVETGEVTLPVYRSNTWTYGPSLRPDHSTPKVDLDQMKRFVDLEEQHSEAEGDLVCLVAINDANEVKAFTAPRSRFTGDSLHLTDLGLDGLDTHLITVGAPEDRVVLMTSEYRFLRRGLQELTETAAVGLSLAEIESFYADAFGFETVSAIGTWGHLQAAERIMLVSSRGEARIIPGPSLLESLDQLHPTQLERLPGEPMALVPLDTRDIILVTNLGVVARILPANLTTGTQRLIRLRKDEQVISAFCLDDPGKLLLIAANGKGTYIQANLIPPADDLTRGIKVVAQPNLRAAIPEQSGTPWAVTSHRLIALNLHRLPLDPPTPLKSRSILHLQEGENLFALHYLC